MHASILPMSQQRTVCVSLLVTTVSCAKMAEQIEVSLEVELVWAGPRNHVLCGGQDPHGKVHFWGHRWAWPDWPAVSILNVFF